MPSRSNNDSIAHAVRSLISGADVVEHDNARPLLRSLEGEHVFARRSGHSDVAGKYVRLATATETLSYVGFQWYPVDGFDGS